MKETHDKESPGNLVLFSVPALFDLQTPTVGLGQTRWNRRSVVVG